MANTIQTTYSINPPVGFKGTIAEPNAPTLIEVGSLHVPTTATDNPMPGDAVYWNVHEPTVGGSHERGPTAFGNGHFGLSQRPGGHRCQRHGIRGRRRG